MESRKSKLIEKISEASGDGDLLLDFMELNNIDSLRTARIEQLEQYIADRGDIFGSRKTV